MMTMYRSLRRILFPSCHLLLIAISLFLTLPGPSESAQEWKSHKHDFSPTISDGPFYVPFLSRWLGLMPPLTFDDEELVIARLQDYFLSKPEQSWEAYQPMWRGGCANGILGITFWDGFRIVMELESWVRDIVDAVIFILRFVACVLLSIFTTMDGYADEIMAEIGDVTVPDVYNRPRFVPESKYPTNVKVWDDRASQDSPDMSLRIIYKVPAIQPLKVLGKRERLDDRLAEYTPWELEIMRCTNHGIEILGYAAYYFPKAWYYFFPFINKFYGRALEWIIKIAFTTLREYVTRDVWGFDPNWCYFIDTYTGMEGSPWSFGAYCRSNERWIFELAVDIGNAASNDFFCEVIDFCKWVLFDQDNRMTNIELEIFSNVTYVKAADSPDHLRYDKTSRIDYYYKDYASKIMCNENYEHHNDAWSRTMLMRTKWEWCNAVFLPPINDMDRTEWKSKYMVRLFKNDHQLDIYEYSCIMGPYAENLVYNGFLESNCTYIQKNITCFNRVMERMEDIIDAIPRLDESILTEVQESMYAEGIEWFIRHLQKIADQNPMAEVFEDLRFLAQKFCTTVNQSLGECISTKERRMRITYELEILRQMINAEPEHIKIQKMNCG